MFWGRGDSSKLAETEKATLDHLRRLVETEHIVALDHEQALIALRAIEFYSQWESVLRLLNSIKNIGLLVGALLALYWATNGAIAAWVVEKAGGAQ